MRNLFLSTLLLGVTFAANAQHAAKIVDSQSGEVIPFANVSVGTENLISNSEGYFTLPNAASDSKVLITCMGYVGSQTTVGRLANQDYVIKLAPAMYELDDVSVTRPDAKTIMANVKKNLAKHYTNTVPVAKDMVFIRESTNFTPEKMEFEITESTGFSKKSLAAANSDLNTFAKRMKMYPPRTYTDILANYYSPAKSPSKFEVVQATKLMDESQATTADQMNDVFTKLMLKHLDTMKYYRIKSGWIGSRDTVSLRKDFKAKKNKKAPKNELTNSKGMLTGLLSENNFLAGSKLTFVTQPEIYEYTYDGATFINNDDLVYVLKFKPKKGKALYTGKLYVSAEDFAVIRTDYSLAKGKTEGGINVKWLLGIKFSENVSKGTTIYKQNVSGEGYFLQYATIETGQYFYLNRPLKYIELAKDEKDVFALDVKVEGNMREKIEFLNIARTEINEPELANVSENNFKYTILKKYDPTIWAKYSAIEPVEEMKRFSAVE